MGKKSKHEPHLTWNDRGRFYTEQILPVELNPIKSKSLNPDKSENLIIDGDNLSVMAALLSGSFQLRNSVDLLLWDPPYNTRNKDFRYKDDYVLNKQEVAQLEREGMFKSGPENGWVSLDDPSRHTKWLNTMAIRLWYGKKLLKESGIIAVCIDYNELFRLGMLMDEIFGEKNRLGIINWQRRYSPSNDSNHISPTTEYVLVYAKKSSVAQTGKLDRTDKMNEKYKSPDNDPSPWKSGDPAVKTYSAKDDYGIQNPFNGKIEYPAIGSSWRFPKRDMKKWLEEWGVIYCEKKDPKDPKKNKALLVKGSLKDATKRANKRYSEGTWPKLYFMKNGEGRPAIKRYLEDVQQGRVPCSFFEELDAYGEAFEIGSQSWTHNESGHTDKAVKELNSVMGFEHNFDTVKPLSLIKKIIQIWCPESGLIIDAFAGSGTTAHAAIELNSACNTSRRFILIECGQGDDRFCDTLTAERIRRVITGKWADKKKHTKINTGFTYLKAGRRLGREAIMQAQREELADIILQASHETSGLIDCRVDDPTLEFIIGKTRKGEAIALIWGNHGNIFEKKYAKSIRQEAEKLGLKTPIHIYATLNKGPNGADWYNFCPIPDSILSALGLSTKTKDRNDEK